MSCRAFEERLALDTETLVAAPVAEAGHAAGCPACGALLERLRENALLFGRLIRPEPEKGFLERLGAAPPDFAARRESLEVLALLEGGALARPEPSAELLSRLAFLPTRARASRRAERDAKPGFFARVFADWRVTVAVVYAVLFFVVAALRVDPLSVARGAASDLTATGARVLGEARTAALARLESTQLTKRLDYRLYRTVVASRARAAAYAQLLFEKVTGGSGDESAAVQPRKAPRRPSREPAERRFRSSTRANSERVETI
jgi:hypothetical protein